MTAIDYAALVERLRSSVASEYLCLEAADAIERLSQQATALRDAVKIAVDYARDFEDCPFVKGEQVLAATAPAGRRETLLDAHAAQVERENFKHG